MVDSTPHPAGAAVHDPLNVPVKIVQHLLGGFGAGLVRGVGGGGRQGHAGLAENGLGQRVVGQRTPRVPDPSLTRAETTPLSSKIMVRGPGQ